MTSKDNLIGLIPSSVENKIKLILAKQRSISVEEVTHISPEQYIQYSLSLGASQDAMPYRVSKRLAVANKQIHTIANCAVTGINIGIDIPRVPGFFLSYVNPLADYANCREIAQRGYSYLQQLDSQVLAGILIVLADNYSLFEFPPASTGAEKNAVLRSAGKEEIIKAVLFIERNVHSNNFRKIPNLSLIPLAGELQWEMSSRLHNWVKTALSALQPVSPKQLLTEDIGSKSAKFTGGYTYIRKQAAEKKKQQAALKKLLSVAAQSTRELFKDGILTIQVRNYLLKTFDIDTFSTVSSEFKAKLSLKVQTIGLNDGRTEAIQTVLALKTDTVELEEFDSIGSAESARLESPVRTSEASASTMSQQPEQQNTLQIIASTAQKEQSNNVIGHNGNAEIQIGVRPNGEIVYANLLLWNSLSFIQKLKHKRAEGIR